MKSIKNTSLQIICLLLIFLWTYAAASKLMDFTMFRVQMHLQLLPSFMKGSMAYILPPLEIATALLLIFDRWRTTGLFISFLMLFAFSIYVGLAVFKVFKNIPCSCGGILNRMGWNVHFVFNVFFLLLTALGIYINNRERRHGSQL